MHQGTRTIYGFCECEICYPAAVLPAADRAAIARTLSQPGHMARQVGATRDEETIDHGAASSQVNILFIHQNFPGQFKHLAPALAAQPGNRVLALVLGQSTARQHLGGVEIHPYQAARSTSREIHPWVADFETKTIRGEACFRAALALAAGGFTPDVIIAHPGWGETLFIKEVWPQARLGIYCEFYYHSRGTDVNFDPEFPDTDPGTPCRLRLKNTNNILHFDLADAAIAPTWWQASTFPQPFREKIEVIHDGINTQRLAPADDVWLKLGDSLKLTRDDEVITFANRNLEPVRGYHVFMRALPELLQAPPQGPRIYRGWRWLELRREKP